MFEIKLRGSVTEGQEVAALACDLQQDVFTSVFKVPGAEPNRKWPSCDVTLFPVMVFPFSSWANSSGVLTWLISDLRNAWPVTPSCSGLHLIDQRPSRWVFLGRFCLLFLIVAPCISNKVLVWSLVRTLCADGVLSDQNCPVWQLLTESSSVGSVSTHTAAGSEARQQHPLYWLEARRRFTAAALLGPGEPAGSRFAELNPAGVSGLTAGSDGETVQLLLSDRVYQEENEKVEIRS